MSKKYAIRIVSLTLILLVYLPSILKSQECSPDIEAPLITCRTDFVTYILEGFDPEVEVLAAQVLLDLSDNCSANDDLILTISDDPDIANPPISSSILLGEGNWEVSIWVTDEAGNSSSCVTTITVEFLQVVQVIVFEDTNGDCIQNPGEEGLPNRPIRFTTLSNISGGGTLPTNNEGKSFYWIQPYPDYETDVWTFELLVAGGLVLSCPTIASINPSTPPDVIYFGIQGGDTCENLYVDISTFRLRPCRDAIYHVNYFNSGHELVSGVEVIVELDEGIILEDASEPFVDLGNNVFAFLIGDLDGLTWGQIKLETQVDCDLPLGVTKCARAEINPFGCDEINEAYTGPSLIVTGECDEENEQVHFQISNVGAGDMTESVDYVVVEDVVMYMEAPVQLNSMQSLDLNPLPANGATWRLSVPQPEGHPGLSAPTIFIEGCGGLSPDMVNLFPLDEADPNVAIHCEVVSGPYDPNDKQAFPRGYGEEHYIEANTGLEYMIRFQNTGTDTAFNVVIEDQLDSALVWESVRGGASSHPYYLSIDDTGLLSFHFDNIMLPDSNVSVDNSQGFVQFQIAQKPDNPIGTLIQNEAAIFFDFNEPIITNQVEHRIGEDFITATIETIALGLEVLVHPNPFYEEAKIDLVGWEGRDAQLVLFDSQGRLLKRTQFTGSELVMKRETLSSGLFFFRIEEGGRLLATGKLMVQ